MPPDPPHPPRPEDEGRGRSPAPRGPAPRAGPRTDARRPRPIVQPAPEPPLAAPADAPAAAAPPTPAGARDPFLGQTIAGYAIRERLATGPRLLTFLADQPTMARRVLVHVLTPEAVADRDTLLAFYRAARGAARVDHPHILAIYAVSSAGTLHYCAMEHVEGESLGALLRARQKLTPDDAIRIAITVGDALRAASQSRFQGLLLSLENVFLTASGQVKLRLPLFVRADAPVLGDACFLSAIGVLLYACLSGGRPASVEEALEPGSRAAAALPPIRQAALGTPQDVARVVGSLVGNDPEAGPFSSLEAGLAALRALLEVKEQLEDRARKTTQRVRAQHEKGRRLRRITLLVGTGALLALLAFLVLQGLAGRTVRRGFALVRNEALAVLDQAAERRAEFLKTPTPPAIADVVARYQQAAGLYRGFIEQHPGAAEAAQAAEDIAEIERVVVRFQADAQRRLRTVAALRELDALGDQFDAEVEQKLEAGGTMDTDAWTSRFTALVRRYPNNPQAAATITSRLQALLRRSHEFRLRLEAQALHRTYEAELRPAHAYGKALKVWDDFRRGYERDADVREAIALLHELGTAVVLRDADAEFARRHAQALALAAQPQSRRAACALYRRIIAEFGLSPTTQQARVELARLGEGTATPDVYLSDLTPLKATVGWGSFARRDRSIQDNPLSIAGETYPRGMGVHAVSELLYDLEPTFARFVAFVGLDDEKGPNGGGSVVFEVYADGQRLFQSGVKRRGDEPDAIDVDLPRGAKQLRLVVADAGDNTSWDHGDWANAGFLLHR